MKHSHMFDGPILVPLAAKCVREIHSKPSIDSVLEGNPRRPGRFSPLFLLGLSAVRPVFDDVDTRLQANWRDRVSLSPYSRIVFLARTLSFEVGMGLSTLLSCWCGYTKSYGYKPLGWKVNCLTKS
jgi:hypothetical protein